MLEKGQIYTDGYCLYQIELIDSDTVVYSIKNKKFTVKRASFEAMIYGEDKKIPFRLRFVQ